MLNNICIIPARGGSKRIPRKNIRLFCGKPMIAYALETAFASKLFRHVIVSTDDPEIERISRFYGAEVPFSRPKELATDFATTSDVINHGIEEVEAAGFEFTRVCCMYPAVPLAVPEDIRAALKLLNDRQNLYSFPVAEFRSAVQRSLRIDANGRLYPIMAAYQKTRTQDLTRAFHDAGQFYWALKSTWKKRGNIHENGIGLVLPRWRALDIDTEDDWREAEIAYKVKDMYAQ